MGTVSKIVTSMVAGTVAGVVVGMISKPKSDNPDKAVINKQKKNQSSGDKNLVEDGHYFV